VIALAMLACIIAFIVGLIIKAAEVAKEAGSIAVRRSSDFAHYIKHAWEEANEVHDL